MATIIIPAYNEANVIRRCLNSLRTQKQLKQIIVACNGCIDDTANIVRTEYPDVICLDIKRPSKVNAINEAEKIVKHWPVIYLDADLELSIDGVEKMILGMKNRHLLIASPTPIMCLEYSNWVVKQYYNIHRKLSYVQEGIIGTGTFVLNLEGRKRFDKFPDVINDDHFVRCQFTKNEMGNIEDSFVKIQAPKNTWSLIKILTRSQLGNIEISENLKGLDKEKPNYFKEFIPFIFSKNILSIVTYILVVSFAKLRAKRQYKKLDTYNWEVDSSSRN